MPPRSNQDRRTNGFQPPFTAAQVATWIALPVLVMEFLVFVSPVLSLGASIPCTIVFGMTAVLASYYASMATSIDPKDDYLAKHLKRKANGEQTTDNNNNGFGASLGNPGEEVEPLKHCWICETQVAEHAMHCKFCNKCVGNFDHHCMWLNTCIGKANYSYFLWTMNYITLMLVVHCAIHIALIADIFLDGESRDRANQWFEADASNAIVGVLIGFAAFDAIALSLIIQLLHFHMQLKKEGLTTYKFIVRETQRKREKKNNEQERKNKRIVAMGKANDEGKYGLACQLRYGEMLPCCDPLPNDDNNKDADVDEEPETREDKEATQEPVKDVSENNNDDQTAPQSSSNGHAAGDDSLAEADKENNGVQQEQEALISPQNGENGQESNGDGRKDENSVQFVKVSQDEN